MLKKIGLWEGGQKGVKRGHREKLMEILSAYGVPTKIVEAINILYKDTIAQVLTPDGDTKSFLM